MTHLFWTSRRFFDTLPHELLKSKLFGYGISGKTLRWIDAFLCYRTQRAVVNGETLEWAFFFFFIYSFFSGVPQGTVLGPLFNLYMNDISTGIDSERRFFADDCFHYREIRDTDDSLKPEEYRQIRMLGQKMGYEISASQMQYNADN